MTATVHGALRVAATTAVRAGAGLRFLDRHEKPTFYDWPTVYARAEAAAASLWHAGVRADDRVAIVLPTGISFFDAYFGCQRLGAVPVPMYPPVRLGRLDEYVQRTSRMMRVVDAVAVITDTRVGRILGQVVEAAQPPLGTLHVDRLLSTRHGVQAPAAVDDPDALAMVQFSSGTTVDPKPVALTHKAVLANAQAVLASILATTPLDGPTPPGGVSWLPLYHDMGLIGCVFPALLGPGPLTLIPPELFLAKPAVWLRAISTYRGTCSPAPDFAYALCVERIADKDLTALDLSTWRMALDGAEPIRPDTLRAFVRRFGPYGFKATAVMPVYGLSEASLAVTFTLPGQGLQTFQADADALRQGHILPAQPDSNVREVVKLGGPLPGFSLRIVDPIGRTPLPDGRIGLLLIKGPSLMQGYLGREDQPFDAEGWLDTGDLGAIVQGQLVLTARQKDVIVLRGRNHAPQDIEAAVDSVDGVRTGCVAAVGDLSDEGERLLVFAEVREAAKGQADAAIAAVQKRCGVRPSLVVLLEPGTLPRTSSGKIRRAETLQRWQDGTLTPPDAVTALHLGGALARSVAGYFSATVRGVLNRKDS